MLGLAIYANALNGEFIWDDQDLVRNNMYIKNFSHLPRVFSGKVTSDTDKKSGFFRPLQMLTYMVDYALWGLNVRGYHLTNILLHILAALSLYWLINLILSDNLLALLSGILFLVHPVHSEAVCYISGRADPLALVFMLSCLILYIKLSSSKNTALYILMLLSYALALLSKENSLILPGIILLYHYGARKQLALARFLPLLGMAVAYILLRLTVLRHLFFDIPWSTNLLQRIPGFFVAITNYVRIMLLPLNLHMEYANILFPITHPQAITGILIFLFLLIYAFATKKTDRFALFCILWFFIALLPYSNLYPLNAYMAEHWLYLPSIGFLLLIAGGLTYIYRRKGRWPIVAATLAASLLAAYSLLTIKQNTYWSKPLTFYKRTLKYTPGNAALHNKLGLAYHNINQLQEAINSYVDTIEIDPGYAEAYVNLGAAYEAIDKTEDAVILYMKAIEANPRLAKAYNNLGKVYYATNRIQEAIASYNKAININPGYAEAFNNLANLYYTLKESKPAVELYKKAIEIDPDYAEAYYNLAVAYSDISITDKAIALYKKAIEINPRDAKAYNNLGIIYNTLKQADEAIALYEKAIEINPDLAEVYNNLGNAYYAINKNEQSVAAYQKAITIKPNYPEAYNNLGNAYYASKRIEEAIASYKQAIEINPEHASAYFNLAVIYFYDKQFGLAIQYCDKASQLGFTNRALLEALTPHRKKK